MQLKSCESVSEASKSAHELAKVTYTAIENLERHVPCGQFHQNGYCPVKICPEGRQLQNPSSNCQLLNLFHETCYTLAALFDAPDTLSQLLSAIFGLYAKN